MSCHNAIRANKREKLRKSGEKASWKKWLVSWDAERGYSPLKQRGSTAWERKIEQVRKPRILIICVPLGKPFTFSDICRKNEKIQDNLCLIQRLKVLEKMCFICTGSYMLLG